MLKRSWVMAGAVVLGTVATTALAGLYGDTPDELHAWAVHDMNRPRPAVVKAEPGKPPADAVVLFDGSSLDAWVMTKEAQPCKWKIVEGGAMEVVPGSGEIRTKESFGDCQLHIEFATPSKVESQSQGRGNSGVFLMGMHEIQILDSYENDTYPDGQCASVYAENPPLVNVSRAPGEWQSYDIIFHQPIWEDGKMKYPGSVTVMHNGVVVQDHWEFEGMSTHCRRRPLSPYQDKLPLKLQDHGNHTRFRNIWIREIPSRYANTTHGGPAANKDDVRALRQKTAAELFERANPGDSNKAAALHRLLEVIGYDKSDRYLEKVKEVSAAYLAELEGLDGKQANDRKGEIIGVRNACNVLIRNKVAPEDCELKAGLQKIIARHELEKRR